MPAEAEAEEKVDHRERTEETKAWKEIWAAGQGVRSVSKVQSAVEGVADLGAAYAATRNTP